MIMCYQYLNWFKYTVMKNISHADALSFLHYWEEFFADVLCGAVGKFIFWQGRLLKHHFLSSVLRY